MAWLLLPALLGLAPASQAQYLRAGGGTLVVSPSGNDFDNNESDWRFSSAGAQLTRATSSFAGGANGQMEFTAGFGLLRSLLSAEVQGEGPRRAQAGGQFASFNNFVGAGFDDTITLAGAGPVSLRIGTSLHSVLGVPDTNTEAEVQLKVDAFSPIFAGSGGRINQGALVHQGSGERITAASFTVNGVAGDSFDLLVEMSGYVNAKTLAGEFGERRAFADASHTGLLTITALSGSFTSASGATYAAVVPEPASWLSLALGLALLGVHARGRAHRIAHG